MPTHRDDRLLGAGATVTNILTGTIWEFAGVPTALIIYAVVETPAAGDEGDVSMDVLFGSTVEGQAVPIPTAPAVNQGPNRDQHQLFSGIATPGDRIQIRLVSVAAAGYRVRTLIDFRPLA